MAIDTRPIIHLPLDPSQIPYLPIKPAHLRFPFPGDTTPLCSPNAHPLDRPLSRYAKCLHKTIVQQTGDRVFLLYRGIEVEGLGERERVRVGEFGERVMGCKVDSWTAQTEREFRGLRSRLSEIEQEALAIIKLVEAAKACQA